MDACHGEGTLQLCKAARAANSAIGVLVASGQAQSRTGDIMQFLVDELTV